MAVIWIPIVFRLRLLILDSSDKSVVNVILSSVIEPKDYLFAYATAFQHANDPLIDFDTKGPKEGHGQY